MVINCQGVSSCAICYMCILFVTLVTNFMVLNCYYYFYVRSDPSFAGRFSIRNDATTDVFIVPILVTLALMAVYYLQFIVAMFMGCARLCRKETAKARKVSFIIG